MICIRNILRTAVAAALLTPLIALQPTPALAADACRSSSYIPGLSRLTLARRDGTTVSLMRTVQRGVPSVDVWVDDSYQGRYDVPFTLGAEIAVRSRQALRMETWMGGVRQALKLTPYVTVCGPWTGDLR
jgi:hypothetical protein